MHTHQKKHADIGAPVSLGGLFCDDDSGEDAPVEEFDQVYDEQEVTISLCPLVIRQYAWHMANANKGYIQKMVAYLEMMSS